MKKCVTESGVEDHKTRNIMYFGHTVATAAGTWYTCVSVMLFEMSSLMDCLCLHGGLPIAFECVGFFFFLY